MSHSLSVPDTRITSSFFRPLPPAASIKFHSICTSAILRAAWVFLTSLTSRRSLLLAKPSSRCYCSAFAISSSAFVSCSCRHSTASNADACCDAKDSVPSSDDTSSFVIPYSHDWVEVPVGVVVCLQTSSATPQERSLSPCATSLCKQEADDDGDDIEYRRLFHYLEGVKPLCGALEHMKERFGIDYMLLPWTSKDKISLGVYTDIPYQVADGNELAKKKDTAEAEKGTNESSFHHWFLPLGHRKGTAISTPLKNDIIAEDDLQMRASIDVFYNALNESIRLRCQLLQHANQEQSPQVSMGTWFYDMYL